MKIDTSRTLGGIRSTRRAEAPTRSTPTAAPATATATAAPREIQDTTSIMGIPAEEMTPKVRNAIMTLMEEVGEVRRAMDSAHRRIAELEKLADQDPLVQMANRRAFVRELGRMISFSARYNIPTSIVYFDLNDLKMVNDRHGHNAGDAALIHVAGLLQAHIRESDLAGRLGGDEFAIILPNASEQAAQDKGATLAQLIAQTPLDWEGEPISLSVAHGAYSFRPGENADAALAEADRKMYAQKRTMKAVAAP